MERTLGFFGKRFKELWTPKFCIWQHQKLKIDKNATYAFLTLGGRFVQLFPCQPSGSVKISRQTERKKNTFWTRLTQSA